MRARHLLHLLAIAGTGLATLPGPVAAAPRRPAPAVAAPAPAEAPPQVGPSRGGIAHVAPELAGVVVEGSAARRALAAYDDTFDRLNVTILARTTAEAELAWLVQRDLDLTASLAALTVQRKQAALRLAAAREVLRELAVGTYVLSATYDGPSRVLDVERSTEVGSVHVQSDAVREAARAGQLRAEADVGAAMAGLDAAHDERLAVRQRVIDVTTARDTAVVDEARFTAELGVRVYELDQARATSLVAGTDFTLVALDAYWKGAASSGTCQIPWWALAGIGRVEGRHGTYAGSDLGPDGQVSPSIIGIPLSGVADTAIVGDTDGGRLDGDGLYDRAVGPMQFIPSTWAGWGRDGDRDGDVDPQNMYDAVAAAAAYLCHGRTMRTENDLRAGFFSYNHSEVYVEVVLDHALNYSTFDIPPPPAPPPVPPTYPGR